MMMLSMNSKLSGGYCCSESNMEDESTDHESVAIRDQVEMASFQQEQYAFERKKLKISWDISHDFATMIFIWCPTETQVRPDFIATVLQKTNKKVNLRSRWGFLPSSRIQTWSGAVAEYASEDAALAAILELTTSSRYVKAVKLDWLLDQFIDAELRHPSCDGGSTRILVRGVRSFPVEEEAYWDWQFRGFGYVHSIEFFPDRTDYNVICEVNYEYASQAQAAQLYLDGLFHGFISEFRVEVADTTKVREIFTEVQNKLNGCFR